MKHQLNWNKTLLEDFIKEGLLSDTEAKIMEMRIKNKSVVEQSQKLNVSVETINRIVVNLKIKYDNLHSQFPNRFPPRKRSNREKFSTLVDNTVSFPYRCINCQFSDDENMTALELIECQMNCKLK